MVSRLVHGGHQCLVFDMKPDSIKELASQGATDDVGTSGGVWGIERGFCLMIEGEGDAVRHLEPIFKTLAPGRGDIPAHTWTGKGSWHG